MEPGSLWPFAVYAAAVVAVVGGLLGLSALLGERHRGGATGEPYESGMPVLGGARVRVTPRFYLVAMMFVIFDIETAFLFPWAVSVREVGWTGLVEVAVFVGVLLIGLVWVIRVGALDWAPKRTERPRRGL